MPRCRENQSWVIHSAVFVATVTLQKKFLLSRKLSRNPGSIPNMCIHMFLRPRESIWPGCSWKALLWEYGVDGCRLLVVKSPYSCSEDCVCVTGANSQPFSASVGLRQWCVLSSLLFIVYIRVLHTAVRGPNPTYEAISIGRKTHFANNEKIIQYMHEKCVDSVECNISWEKYITQDIWPSNCCAIAYVVSPKKFEEPWSVWIG